MTARWTNKHTRGPAADSVKMGRQQFSAPVREIVEEEEEEL